MQRATIQSRVKTLDNQNNQRQNQRGNRNQPVADDSEEYEGSSLGESGEDDDFDDSEEEIFRDIKMPKVINLEEIMGKKKQGKKLQVNVEAAT